MTYPNSRKRKDILDHVLADETGSKTNKKARGKPNTQSSISSGSSTSVQTSQWLPPISSMLPPMYDQMKPHPSSNHVPVMPMIPYFFHHKQFGLEACMNQLEYQRQQYYRCHLNDPMNFYRFHNSI